MSRPREPLVRDGITEAQIERLVREFYTRIREDDRLGPIFESKLGGQWEPHLLTMIDFWSSLMLTTGRYSGRPLQKHLALDMVQPEDFDIWLRLFRETAISVGGDNFAAAFLAKAERVAASFKMAMFDELGVASPHP
ncbi:MAG: group III truncated hemoglobin [Devosia sp.]